MSANSTCKRCGQYGHWAASCAFSSQAAAEAAGHTPQRDPPREEPSKEPQPARAQPPAERSMKELDERRAQLVQEIAAIDHQKVIILGERRAKQIQQKMLQEATASMANEGW